jgi:hypothetical protein
VVHGFLYDGTRLADIGVLPGFLRTFALDMNESREVIGYCRTLSNGSDTIRGFVWTNGSMRTLNELILPSSGLDVKVARAISHNGSICGHGTDVEGNGVAYLLTPMRGPLGDVTGDCHVDIDDLLAVIDAWGPCYGGSGSCLSDANHDGMVNVMDLLQVIQDWGF